MLRTLSIRDVVIVTTLELEFTHGFNVLSGETGAGKSILLGALGLALGEKADASIVREGAQRADVCAEFHLVLSDHPELMQWLSDNALDPLTEETPISISKKTKPVMTGTILLRRTLDTNGRSKAFINGIPVTLSQLRELSRWLVDIHGQHAHQLLLQNEFQRQLLDRHANLVELADSVKQHYDQLQTLNKMLANASEHSEAQEREREQLEWKLEEFEKLAPQTGEWEQLQQEHGRLAHGAHLIENIQLSVNDLDAENNALSLLNHTCARLTQLLHIDPHLHEIVELLEGAKVQTQEAIHTLHRYAQHLELDPERLASIDERLQAFHATARKYKIAPEELLAEYTKCQDTLAQLKQSQDLEAIRAEQTQAHQAYHQAAQILTQHRQSAAKKLAQEVTHAMQTLAMSGGCFDISLKPLAKESAHGLEQIEFLVAAHPGATAKPLGKVASGGELSRISLALSVITSLANPTPTLIFDEVDSGIGGTVAEIVGQRLRQLGTHRQVLCITHLAQVAALAHQQFRVSKHSQAGQTQSHITLLNSEERIDEIARMLGGTSTTAKQHAQTMLEQL